MYQKSLPLFNELGSPDVEEITGLLKDLRKAVSCKADEKR
jgi:hypothetical protein